MTSHRLPKSALQLPLLSTPPRHLHHPSPSRTALHGYRATLTTNLVILGLTLTLPYWAGYVISPGGVLFRNMWTEFATLRRQYGRLRCAPALALFLDLFSACVTPSACYWSEVWSFISVTPAHSGFPENTQGLAGSNIAATRRGPYLCVHSHSRSRA